MTSFRLRPAGPPEFSLPFSHASIGFHHFYWIFQPRLALLIQVFQLLRVSLKKRVNFLLPCACGICLVLKVPKIREILYNIEVFIAKYLFMISGISSICFLRTRVGATDTSLCCNPTSKGAFLGIQQIYLMC